MPGVNIEFPVEVVYRHPVRLRISDINYGQHLGHDTLVSLLHDARCGWLKANQLSELSLDGGTLGWVVADLSVKYQAEAFYGDELVIELAVGDIGRKGAAIFQQVIRPADGRVIALAQVGVVFFDFVNRCAAPVPTRFLTLAGRD